MALAKTVLSTVGSVAAIIINIFTKFLNQLMMVIDEFNGLVNNEIYEAAETYLGKKLSPNIHRLKISKPEHHYGT
ncbi:hypothetical protein H5410_014083 [Solanum commersonii]|uniref:AAA-type ATPase N-terminal domain-containing protein n=1 Tax=Solanum commersonii TaxID=4109 RepID=A0A9J5ZQ76_SOLCO|nr:hypothetical protein H5410_014083 [Solanum commersonii]